jgi:hypothetical protein
LCGRQKVPQNPRLSLYNLRQNQEVTLTGIGEKRMFFSFPQKNESQPNLLFLIFRCSKICRIVGFYEKKNFYTNSWIKPYTNTCYEGKDMHEKLTVLIVIFSQNYMPFKKIFANKPNRRVAKISVLILNQNSKHETFKEPFSQGFQVKKAIN